MKEKIIYTFCLCLLGFGAYAQTTEVAELYAGSNENVYLHANTTNLLAGETFMFAFYTLNTENNSLSQVSKMGYVELIGPGGEVVIKQKVALDSGKGSGDFFIPTSFETGNYTLVAYTQWMLNRQKSELFQTRISVVNPFQLPKDEYVEVPEAVEGEVGFEEATQAPASSRMIQLSKSNFSVREKVNARIVPNEAGTYSVSVRKLDGSFNSTNVYSNQNSLNSNNNAQPNGNFLPELRGEMLTGKVTDKETGAGIANKAVSMSIPGQNFLLRIVNTDEEGNFRFILEEQPKNEEVFIQVMDDAREQYEIVLNASFANLRNLHQRQKLQLDPAAREEIEARSVALQIENAYYQQKRDSILADDEHQPFYAPLAKDYYLDNYNRFPTLAETIVEIIPEMYYNRKNGNYSIHLRDYTKGGDRAMYGATLVMVDGLVLQDLTDLFAYPAKNIHKISLVNQGYVYGPKIFNGVVNIITKNQDYHGQLSDDTIFKSEIARPLPKKEYFQPNYDQERMERIPDFRYQLAWIPSLNMNGGQGNVWFFTSDVTGTFEISLEGFTENGEPVSQKTFFTVE